MKIANVNDYEQAKLFFDEFNIPYEVVTRGENKGKLRVKPNREKDRYNLFEAEKRLQNAGLGHIVDHSRYFRDADDNTVCTFSPYDLHPNMEGVPWLKVSDHSIYGCGTRTYVVTIHGKRNE